MIATPERLREVLSYNPDTGVLTWLVDIGHRFKAGDVAGSVSAGYVCIGLDGHHYKAHRIAFALMTGEWPTNDVDHENRDRGDNRWANLREASKSQNLGNSPKRRNNTSGFKGVCWKKQSRKWTASIREGGRQVHLGYFDDPKEAHAAYCAKAAEVFGEFARAA